MVSKRDLNIKIESINNKNYCTLRISEDEEILNYEINMIKNNPSIPFLELDVVQVNEVKKMLYEIGSKMSFSQLIETKKYDAEKIISILENIYTCAIGMKEYMLDSRKMVLDCKFIFIDNNLVPYMIYTPFHGEDSVNIQENFNELFDDIEKEMKKYKYMLTSNDKRMLNKITSSKVGIDDIGRLFVEYRKKKDEERLLSKPIKQEECIVNENIDKEEVLVKTNIDEGLQELSKLKYKSVIEENYSEFDEFDNEDDLDDYLKSELEYEEYKDIYSYDKKINSKQKEKKIIIMQLIVLMLLGSLGLIISYEDKKIFTLIAIAMAVVMVIFTILIISNNKNEGK